MDIARIHPDQCHQAHAVLTSLHLECFRESELRPGMFSQGAWWLAFDHDVAVGFAGIVPSVRWRDVGYLCRAGVSEIARGQGLQRRLIQVRVAHARRQGLNYVVTDTRRNPASANNLIECGFRMYEPRLPWSFKDSCYWKRELFK